MRTGANLGRTRLTRADEGRQLKTRASHIDDQGDGTTAETERAEDLASRDVMKRNKIKKNARRTPCGHSVC